MLRDDGTMERAFSGSPDDCRSLAAFYRKLLLDDLLPWWEKHAFDPKHPGLFSCIGDDGTVLSTDKYVWSQVRALWTFAAACRRVEKRDSWMEFCRRLVPFLAEHCIGADGAWNHLVGREGETIEGPESIQCDAYALCALAEYLTLTDDATARDLALRTYRR